MNSHHLTAAPVASLVRHIGALVAGFALIAAGNASAQTFNPTNGTQSWNVNSNWTPSGFPNSVGASATFNSPTAAETVNLAAAITVGAINFTNNSGFVLTLANGTGGSLILDATGSAEATITVTGTSTTTNNVTISASTTLNDTLRFTNNNVSGTGAATTTMTGAVTGSGGFIKDGPGRFTFSTVAKAYTGATVVNQGRLRYTASGISNATSSVTVNSGGSLYLDQNSGTFAFGSAPASTIITLNGDGDNGGGSGTQGALRNNGTGTTHLTNPVTLGSAATIDPGANTLQLNGALSGSFVLTKSNTGTLMLNNANSGYNGGTTVLNGAVTVSSLSKLGTGALSLAQIAGANTTVTLNNATQSISALSSSFTDTAGTQSQTLNLAGTALTIAQATNTTFGVGAVSTLTSSIAGTGSIIKTSAGTLKLTGANTYTGTTTVSGGTLTAGAVNSLQSTSAIAVNTGGTLLLSGTGNLNRVNNVAGITLAGGTLGRSGAGTVSEGAGAVNNAGIVSGTSAQGLGTLTLSADSTLDFGTGGLGTLTFDDFAPSTFTLNVTNYASAASGYDLNQSGADGIDDRLIFNFDVSGAGFLPNISFNGVGASQIALDTGYFEIVPVPEPGTIFTVWGLLGVAGWRERSNSRRARQGTRAAFTAHGAGIGPAASRPTA